MKAILLLPVTVFVLTICACSKRDGAEENCDDHYIKLQKEKWKDIADCGKGCSYWLGKGDYRYSVIYFSEVQCINWNTAPKTSGVGVNCSGDSITVDNWSEVKNIRLIANCADQ